MMNGLLALIAGASLGAHDGDMRLSYPEYNEIFPHAISFEEPQEQNDDFLQIVSMPFYQYLYSASFDLSSDEVSFSYSIGIGKFGNLISGELLNLTMLRGSIVSEHTRLHLEYSVNTSEFTGDFLEGLFTIKNVLGFTAEFPVCGFTPEVYANMRTRHLLSAGKEDIDFKLGLLAEYAFLEYFAVSAFYEHEWASGADEIGRAGLGFSFFY